MKPTPAPADITAICNENIAVGHMQKICQGYRNHNITTVRIHTRILKQAVENSDDRNLNYAANEATIILRLMGD